MQIVLGVIAVIGFIFLICIYFKILRLNEQREYLRGQIDATTEILEAFSQSEQSSAQPEEI